jgi:predicted nucleotidyltransferase
MTESVRQTLAEARRRLEALYGDRLVRVVLYGSQARGEARSDSDVDVIVVLKGPVNVPAEIKRLVQIEVDLMDIYDEYVSLQPFAEAEYEDRGRPLMMNVHAEGVEL